MENSKIYLVYYVDGKYQDYTLVSIFKNKKDAENYKKEFEQNKHPEIFDFDTHSGDRMHISEETLK